MMAGTAAAAGVGMEIFVKEHEIPPVWVARVADVVPMHRTLALACEEYGGMTALEFPRGFGERKHFARTRRALDLQRCAIEVIVTFYRLDQQIVNRKPDWPAPVRVPTEEISVAFSRCVIDAVLFVSHAKDIRLVAMHARD